jgi:hypothetical protein
VLVAMVSLCDVTTVCPVVEGCVCVQMLSNSALSFSALSVTISKGSLAASKSIKFRLSSSPWPVWFCPPTPPPLPTSPPTTMGFKIGEEMGTTGIDVDRTTFPDVSSLTCESSSAATWRYNVLHSSNALYSVAKL